MSRGSDCFRKSDWWAATGKALLSVGRSFRSVSLVGRNMSKFNASLGSWAEHKMERSTALTILIGGPQLYVALEEHVA